MFALCLRQLSDYNTAGVSKALALTLHVTF